MTNWEVAVGSCFCLNLLCSRWGTDTLLWKGSKRWRLHIYSHCWESPSRGDQQWKWTTLNQFLTPGCYKKNITWALWLKNFEKGEKTETYVKQTVLWPFIAWRRPPPPSFHFPLCHPPPSISITCESKKRKIQTRYRSYIWLWYVSVKVCVFILYQCRILEIWGWQLLCDTVSVSLLFRSKGAQSWGQCVEQTTAWIWWAGPVISYKPLYHSKIR